MRYTSHAPELMLSTVLFVGLVLLCTTVTLASPGPRPAGWNTFRSTKYRYTVRYPASWYEFTDALRPKLDYLDILNFPPSRRVEGVVLIDQGAEITVARAPSHIRTARAWIQESTKLNTNITERKVGGVAVRGSACRKLLEVTFLSAVGPGRNFQGTDYYCAAVQGLYAVSLTNWQGDPNYSRLQRIAFRIALSLRVW